MQAEKAKNALKPPISVLPHGTVKALLILSVFVLFSGFLQKSNPRQKAAATLGVDSEMIVLPTVVTTQDGKRITDLRKEDFRIYEDGMEQEISHFEAPDEPTAVALLLDTSGSTRITLTQMRHAAVDFVNRLHPNAEVMVISFAGNVTLQQNITRDRKKNADGIKGIRSGGMTAVYDAVGTGLEALKLVDNRKTVVLVTDGMDNSSRKISRRETIEMAGESKATIFCVYYNHVIAANLMKYGSVMDPNHPMVVNADYASGWDYLQDLSSNSGGMAFDGTKDLGRAFSEVAKELAGQYSIGYCSTNDEGDEKFRKVEIKVDRPDLKIRTKKGYYARKRE